MLDNIQSMDFMFDDTFKVNRTAMLPFKQEYMALLRRLDNQVPPPDSPSDSGSDLIPSSASSLDGMPMVSGSSSD